jgi:hypothetical protein
MREGSASSPDVAAIEDARALVETLGGSLARAEEEVQHRLFAADVWLEPRIAPASSRGRR